MGHKRTTSQVIAKKKFHHDETVTVALGHCSAAEAIAAQITLMNNFVPGTVIVNYIHLPWKRYKVLTSKIFLQARLVSRKVAQEIILRTGSKNPVSCTQ